MPSLACFFFFKTHHMLGSEDFSSEAVCFANKLPVDLTATHEDPCTIKRNALRKLGMSQGGRVRNDHLSSRKEVEMKQYLSFAVHQRVFFLSFEGTACETRGSSCFFYNSSENSNTVRPSPKAHTFSTYPCATSHTQHFDSRVNLRFVSLRDKCSVVHQLVHHDWRISGLSARTFKKNHVRLTDRRTTISAVLWMCSCDTSKRQFGPKRSEALSNQLVSSENELSMQNVDHVAYQQIDEITLKCMTGNEETWMPCC